MPSLCCRQNILYFRIEPNEFASILKYTLICEFCNTPTILDSKTANSLIPYMNRKFSPDRFKKQMSPLPTFISEPLTTIESILIRWITTDV